MRAPWCWFSHDRYLLEACADQLWVVEDGRVRVFDGDVDDYARHVLSKTRGEEPRAPAAIAVEASVEKPPAGAARRDPGFARRQLASAEERVEKFTKLLARVDAALTAPDAFSRNRDEAARLAAQTRRSGEGARRRRAAMAGTRRRTGCLGGAAAIGLF